MSKQKIVLVITFLFFCLGLIGILNHELWLDEAHHFLLGRGSSGISGLAYNARYDGHPLVWDVLLLFLTHFSHNPFYMQLLHILITTIAAFLFLKYAPFSLKRNTLFVFGYFFLYEYNIISRNYGISLLLLIIICILLSRDKKQYLLIATALVLFANTHLFSLITAIPLSGLAVMLMWKNNLNKNLIGLYLLILIAGFSLALFSAIPPPDHFLKEYDTDAFLSFKRIGKGLSIVMKGLFPFPNMVDYHSWNTNIFVAASKKLAIFPVAVFFFIPALLFIDKPISLFTFYASTIGIMLFIYFSPIIVATRHCGYIFLVFIAALWLEKTLPQQISYNFKRLFNIKKLLSNYFLIPLLLIQSISGIYAYSKDLFYPFSESKAVANELKKKEFENAVIALSNHSSGPPISAYLDKKLFYVENNSFESFCLWNTHPYVISRNQLFERVKQLRKQTKNSERVILVLNNGQWKDSIPMTENKTIYSDSTISINYLSKFDKGMVRSENYTLYEVSFKTIKDALSYSSTPQSH